MNILLINHYAGSPAMGMEFRPYYMAREWVRRGHEVTIAAASFSHLRTVNPGGTAAMEEEWLDGIRYLWFRTPSYGGNDLRRVRNMAAFVSRLLFHHREILRRARPGAVIASSTYPLDIFPAWLIARRAGAKLVFEVHDLWPLSPVELGDFSRAHPFIVAMQAAEDFACRRSDRVVSLLPGAGLHLEARGMKREKFFHIPNGIDVPSWGSPEPLPEGLAGAFRRIRAGNRFVLGYAGGHGVSNALDNLIEAAGLLRGNKGIHFTLVGDGPEKERLKRKAEGMALENVTFFPRVSRAFIPSVLRKFDGAYLGWKREPIYRFGISPNKIMDYMMAGKPVVHAVDAGNDPVAESGCGFSVPPEEPRSLSEAVERLAALSPEERDRMGQLGREYVLGNHNYRHLAERFLAVLEGRSTRSGERTGRRPFPGRILSGEGQGRRFS